MWEVQPVPAGPLTTTIVYTATTRLYTLCSTYSCSDSRSTTTKIMVDKLTFRAYSSICKLNKQRANQMDINNILVSIQSASNSDLNAIIDSVKLRRTRLSRETVRSLQVGDHVQFKGKSGYITKLNRKTAVVDCGAQGSWRVGASLLEG